MKRLFGNIFLLALIGTGVYIYRDPLSVRWSEVYGRYFPCRQPITYSLGSFDARFGISAEQFLQTIKTAESVWEKAIGKDLFAYAPEGRLKMNLIYDYRQEATVKMRALGLTVKDDQASYEALASRYKALKVIFEEKETAYKRLASDIKQRTEAYNAEVSSWNKRKGAPADVYTRLQQESISLKNDTEAVRITEAELQKLQDDVSALVTVVNQVANNINASAKEFNQIGKTQGSEFTEGLYTSDQSGQRIDIFQFNDSEKLTRVLAHELGHALSLEHVDDPKAIMYRLNQGTATWN